MVFQRTTLSNGIRIITERMPHVRSVTIGFWVGVGARDEPQEISGISHFIEHMLFKGTASRTARQLAEVFDSMGGELNAFSAKEYTCYYAKILDDDLDKAIELMTDMIFNPLLQPKDIDAERKVILEEISMHEDSPDDIVHDLFASALWESHPLGQSVLGHLNVVKTLRRDEITSYYKQYYQPGDIVVAAAGNVDHERFCGLIDKFTQALEGWDRSERHQLLPDIRPHIAVYKRQTEQAHIVIGTEGLPRNHPDRFVFAIIDNLLGGGMSSRLFQKIREEKGLAYSIFSYHSMFADTGLMAIYAGSGPSNAQVIMDLIKDEIRDLLDHGIRDDELARAKGHIKGNLVLGLEDSSGRMTRLGKAELCRGEILSLDELIDRVDCVTRDKVEELSRRLFGEGRFVVTILGPFEEKSFQPHLFEV
jgi:predicted Zn-dependent peptidase